MAGARGGRGDWLHPPIIADSLTNSARRSAGATAMKRLLPLLLVLAAAPVAAQPDGVLTGKVKAVDPDAATITITREGSDHVYHVTADTRFASVDGLRAVKVGAEVFFKPGRRGGQDVLVGLKPVEAGRRSAGGERVSKDTADLKPLTELGTGQYHGFPGGLYPDGKNERPVAHEAAGLALARAVRPIDGKIVLVSVGMSNTSQESEGFRQLLARDDDRNPALVFVNGAQGGMTAKAIQNPDDHGSGTRYWDEVDRRLRAAGVSREQVQAVWIKEADAGPSEGFPKYAQTLQVELTKIVQLLPERFPNAKLVYLSSRTYGGYATTRLNPEPYAYESGFAVKWLIEARLRGEPGLNFDPAKGPVKAPWLSWGPYLWANGSTPRADTGLSYKEGDFGGDGTHPSAAGVEKVAREMLHFFKTDSTTRPWFVRAR
jgi:hypothetical protein